MEPIFIFWKKSILTRTVAFSISMQCKTNLVFINICHTDFPSHGVFFLDSAVCQRAMKRDRYIGNISFTSKQSNFTSAPHSLSRTHIYLIVNEVNSLKVSASHWGWVRHLENLHRCANHEETTWLITSTMLWDSTGNEYCFSNCQSTLGAWRNESVYKVHAIQVGGPYWIPRIHTKVMHGRMYLYFHCCYREVRLAKQSLWSLQAH